METLVSLDDLPLMLRVEAAAAKRDLTAGEFANEAVALFSSQASDDDWVSLIGSMGRVPDPGRICLKKMIEFALRPAPAAGGCGHVHPEHAA
jgi:hypothetical protein